MARSAKSKKRWVVKAGSQMIYSGGPLLIRDWMRQIVELRERWNIEVIWVTSGAIATAVTRTRLKKRDRTLVEKQCLSAIGQPLIMNLYNESLQSLGAVGGQLLLCYDDILDRKRRKNFQNTVDRLLDWGVTPILNENDVVSTEEIQFGDNDSLSAKVAVTVSADRLVLLTDVNGLYDSDPSKNPQAQLIPEVRGVSPAILKLASRASGSGRGTGGMASKLLAAQEAGKKGIETWMGRGDQPRILLELAAGSGGGTRIFPPARKKK